MDRIEKLKAHCRIEGGRGLEFGPLASPAVLKSEGAIYYVDVRSAEDLRKIWSADPSVNVDNIPEIDFRLDEGPLREQAAATGPFDYVIACHVFEHLPDPLGWLLELESLLAPDGVISLAIPDKRYTFDFTRRLSTLGDLLGYYHQRSIRPSPVQVLDHYMSIRKVSTVTAWSTELIAAECPRCHSDAEAFEYSRRSAGGEYIDTHCTVWTPGQFLEVIQRLRDLKFLNLQVAAFHWTERDSFEFFATLSKG